MYKSVYIVCKIMHTQQLIFFVWSGVSAAMTVGRTPGTDVSWVGVKSISTAARAHWPPVVPCSRAKGEGKVAAAITYLAQLDGKRVFSRQLESSRYLAT